MTFSRYDTAEPPQPEPLDPDLTKPGIVTAPSVPGYEVVGPLGSGGSGTVWRVRDGGGQEAALKLLHPAGSQTEVARERLLREARLVNKVRGSGDRVKGDGLARVLDVEADALSPFVVTELIQGPTLEQLAGNGKGLPLTQVLALGWELGEVLERVHDAEFAHRDLKPGNVIISESGPVLIDFGLAQGDSDSRITSTGFLAGTPGYVAPELLRMDDPSPEDWKDGDWFAFNALLCFAATGRPPFGAGQSEAVLHRVFTGQVDTAGLDPVVAQAFREALAPDPSQRLPAGELLRLLSQQAVATQRLTAPTQLLEEQADWQAENADTWTKGNAPPWLRADPYTHPKSGRAWALILLLFAVLAAVPEQMGSQWLILGPCFLLLAQVAGRMEAGLVDRRHAWGGKRGSDALVTWATSPWALLVATVSLLPGLAAGFITFVVAGSLGEYLVSSSGGDEAGIAAFWSWLTAPGESSLASPFVLLLATWLGLLVCWSLPTSQWARTGAYRMIETGLPNAWWRFGVATLLLLALAGMLLQESGAT